MTKQEFFIKWRNPQWADWNLLSSDIDALIQTEIADHEAAQWKCFNDELPENGSLIIWEAPPEQMKLPEIVRFYPTKTVIEWVDGSMWRYYFNYKPYQPKEEK